MDTFVESFVISECKKGERVFATGLSFSYHYENDKAPAALARSQPPP